MKKRRKEEEVKMKQKQRSIIDWVVLGVVVMIAGSVISLSYTNTQKLAIVLGLNPILTGVIVEVVFGWLLFIRSRQRATTKNVPWFLHLGYFCSFLFVTSVNMWGLAQTNHWIGCIVGVVISCTMWLMETILVWLWVDADKPHTPSARDLKKEAKRLIKEEKTRQEIAWMLYEAAKPNLDLIEQAREEEQRRQTVCEKGMPIFFQTFEQTDKLPFEQTAKRQTANTIEQTDKLLAAIQSINSNSQTLIQTNTIDQTANSRTASIIDQTANRQTTNTIDQTANSQTANTIDRTTNTIEQTANSQTANTIEQTANSQTADRQTTNDQTTSISNDNRPSKKTNVRTITKQASDKQTLNQTTEKTKRSNKQPTNITELFELANKIKQQTGKYPSIRKFAAAAGITNYQSMKILDKLKKSG